MKYIVKTSGKLCHYQFSNIAEIEVNDIEFGEMDYNELEHTFLLIGLLLKIKRLV